MDTGLKYFDIHSHLDFSQYDTDREEVIEQMKKDGIYTINVGVDKKTSTSSVELANKHQNIFATIGVHPTDNPEDWDEGYFEDLLKSSEKIVGVGECGLDYFRIKESDSRSKESQKKLFIKQLDFALEHNLRVMFHFRSKQGTMDAYIEGLEILSEEKYKGKIKGNSHFFVGNLDIANKFIGLGHTLSFDGPITFSNDYDEVIKSMPIEKIMAETDAPFAAPVPYRGKRNSPLYVKEIYDKISDLKDLDREEVREILNKNAIDFWGTKI